MAIGLGTAIGLGITALGTGLRARSEVRQGRAQEEAAEAQAAVSEAEAERLEYNAGLAGQQAEDAIQRGREEESRYRVSIRGLLGRQRAAFAASGVRTDFGSAVHVREDARRLGEIDALQIRRNAAREAWGYREEATDLRAQAAIARRGGDLTRAAGREAASAGRVNAASTVIGTGSSLLLQRYGWGG